MIETAKFSYYEGKEESLALLVRVRDFAIYYDAILFLVLRDSDQSP